MSTFKYGDIVSVKLEAFPNTQEDVLTRYALIISADIINENLQTVIVCPLIEAKKLSKSRIGATYLPKEEIGLETDCLVFSLQIKTISKDRIVKRVGALPESYKIQIKESLQAVLDIE